MSHKAWQHCCDVLDATEFAYLVPLFSCTQLVYLSLSFACTLLPRSATQLVLCNAHFSKGSFPKFIANPVELMSGSNRLTQFLKVRDNHGDQILLILQQWIKYLSHRYLRLILFTRLSHRTVPIILLLLRLLQLASSLIFPISSIAKLRMDLSICIAKILEK